MQIYSEFTASYAKLTTAQKPEIKASRTFEELFILLTVVVCKCGKFLLQTRQNGSQQRAINRPKRRNEADK